MQEIIRNGPKVILRFDPDEEVIAGIIGYCEKNQIKAAWLNFLGASKKAKLSYYNLQTKEYEDEVFEDFLEVLAVTGNIATLNHKTIVHAHGSFSGRNFGVIGGHVKELVVSATLEVFLDVFEGEILRKHDEFTGLNLMS